MRRLLIGILLFLVAAVALAAALGPRLAPGLVAGRLAALGFPEATVGEVSMGLGSARLSGVTLGPEQTIRRIDVGFAPSGLLRGELAHVAVEGLRIRLRLDEDGLTIPGMSPDTGNGSGAPPPLPARVDIRDAALVVETPAGEVRADVEASLMPDGDRVAITFDGGAVAAEVLGGNLAAELAGEGDLSPFADDPLRSIVAELSVSLEGEGLAVEGLGRTGPVSMDADLAIDGMAIRGRNVRLRGTIVEPSARGTLKALGAVPPITVVAGSEGGGPMTFALDLGSPMLAASVGLPLEVEAGPVSGEATLNADLRLEDDGAVDRFEVSRLAAELRGARAGGLGRLEGLELRFTGAGSPAEATGSGRIVARAEGDGPATGEVTVDLPFALDLDADHAALTLTGGGTIAWDEIAIPDAVKAARGRIEVPPEGGRVRLDRAGGDWALSLPGRLSAGHVEPAAGSAVPDLEVPGGALMLSLEGDGRSLRGGMLGVDGVDLTSAGLAVTATGLDASVPLGRSGIALGASLELSIDGLRDRASPRRFAPLSVDATFVRQPDRLAFDGEVTVAGTPATLEVSGVHLDDATGRASVVMAPVTFAPGALQPRDLSPGLAGRVKEVEGTLGLAGEATWEGAAVASDIELLFDDMALTAGPARFEGIAGVILVDEILPPSTAPDQRLAVGLMDLGLAFTDGTMRFELLPGGPLEIRRLRFAWAGGRIESDPFTVGSPGGVVSTSLHARGLDLDAIFGQVKLPGLRGDGIIDGSLPLRIEGAEAAVEGGELRARGPGWLRYRPEQSPDAFAAGGESMTLLLQALENFRYEDLRITLDGRTDATMDIGLHLGGANPDLYDGHPIEFNLNLEGELANILGEGLRSYTLPDRVRQRIEDFRAR